MRAFWRGRFGMGHFLLGRSDKGYLDWGHIEQKWGRHGRGILAMGRFNLLPQINK